MHIRIPNIADTITEITATAHVLIKDITTDKIEKIATLLMNSRAADNPINTTTHAPAIKSDNNINIGQVQIEKHRTIMQGEYIASNTTVRHNTIQKIASKGIVHATTNVTAAHILHKTNTAVKDTTMKVVIVHDIKKHTAMQIDGTLIAIIRNKVNARGKDNIARDMSNIVNITLTHIKQHNPTMTTAHIPASGTEHIINIGHMHVAIQRSAIHGVYRTNADASTHVIKNNIISKTIMHPPIKNTIIVHPDNTTIVIITDMETDKQITTISMLHSINAIGISIIIALHKNGRSARIKQTVHTM